MIKDVTMIPQLITQAQVCIGNHDKNFISMSAERNGRFMTSTGTPQQLKILKISSAMTNLPFAM